MADLNALLVLFAGVVLVASLAAGMLRASSFLPSELMIATVVGVVVGPLGLGVLRLETIAEPTILVERLARLTIAIAVMSIALELPETYVRDRARSLLVIVVGGMVLMWLASSVVTFWVLPGSVGVALLVGAIVTPTDPVIATSIVNGPTAERNIPDRLRHLLMAEAGANDGIAYAFVFFALVLLGHTDDPTLTAWAVSTIGWELLGAVAIGLVLGVVALAGTDDVLAVFVAGLAYNLTADPHDEEQEGQIEEVFNRLFTVPIFVVFGAAIPWQEWLALGWQAVALVVGILLFRRLPAIVALQRGIEPLDRFEATLFVGWFGPIGVAALFYATLAVHETGQPLPWVLGSLVVTGSIVAHGATATVATHWYGTVE